MAEHSREAGRNPALPEGTAGMTSSLRVLRIIVVDDMFRQPPVPVSTHPLLHELLGRLDTLAYSPLRRHAETLVIAGNASVYPTHSRTKLHFFRDAYALACQLHERYHYDVVWTDDPMGSGLVGYWLKRRYGIPLLIRVHSDYYSSLAWRLENPRYWFDYYLSIWLLRRADRIQAVSDLVAREVVRLGTRPERVESLSLGVADEQYAPGPNTLERYQAGNILFAGRLAVEKRVDVLLRAVRLLLDRGYHPRLTLAGDGPLRQRLEALSKRLALGGVVTFAGHLTRPELVALYQQSSILALTSSREALPKVLVEAGLCGLPTVVSNVGGTSEIVVDGETGILVPPGDVKALGQALARLLQNPNLARSMGQAAEHRLRPIWKYDTMIGRILAMLEHTVQDPKIRRGISQ